MITITLDEVDFLRVTGVERICQDVLLTDPNFNGAQIRVVAGDYTSLDGGCPIAGVLLMNAIRNYLDSE